MIDAEGLADPYVLAQIAARDRQAVIKVAFLNHRSKFPHGIVIAVEGDDDKIVYSYWIRRVDADIAYEFFVCGGKREVRKLRNSLHADRSSADTDVFFLIDRDFDDFAKFASTTNVFMLDRYSVENYLADRCVVDETLKIAFPGSGDPTHRAAICDLFEADYCCFLEITRALNNRIFVARRLAEPIDDVMPNSLAKLATVQLGEVTPCGISTDEALPVKIKAPPEVLAQLEAEFAELDPSSRYRGKFLYKFLRAWFDRLVEEHRKCELGLFPPATDQRGKPKSDEPSLGSLASRSPLPPGFDAFVAHMRTSEH